VGSAGRTLAPPSRARGGREARARSLPVLAASLCLIAAATPAYAYIGPGAGITMLGALWGVIVAVVLAVGAVLFYPVRVLTRRFRRSAPAVAPPGHERDRTVT
jgi:hypothetical protein